MSYKDFLRLANQKRISYYPIHTKLVGSVTGGIALSQLLYWAECKNPFYKSTRELCEETGLSVKEFESVKRNLKRLEFIKQIVKGVPATTWYSVDWNRYKKAVRRACTVPPSGVSKPPLKSVASSPKRGEPNTMYYNNEIHTAAPSGSPKRVLWFVKYAKELAQAIGRGAPQRFNASWGQCIRKIRDVDKVEKRTIRKVLDWYIETSKQEGGTHFLNRVYIPVAESAKTFRDKFFRIEAAMLQRTGGQAQPTVKVKVKASRKATSADENW